MIILSGVLVVVAIALLVAGIVAGEGESAQVLGLDALVVIYISIAVSIVSALCLAIGVFLKRKELFGPGVPASARRTRPPAKGRTKKKPKQPAPAANRAKSPAAADTVAIATPPTSVPDDALVYVVRGRKRYHLDTCRQLAGRDREELTYAEAREEGFSSCTACMPDTALAARAANVTVPAGKVELGKPHTDAPRQEPATGSGQPTEAAPTPAAWLAPTTATDDTPASAAPTDTVSAADEGTVRIISGTKRYHRPDCSLITDIDADSDELESLTATEAKARGCTPCLVCQPV